MTTCNFIGVGHGAMCRRVKCKQSLQCVVQLKVVYGFRDNRNNLPRHAVSLWAAGVHNDIVRPLSEDFIAISLSNIRSPKSLIY